MNLNEMSIVVIDSTHLPRGDRAMMEQILLRLDQIEMQLNRLVDMKAIQEWYDTKTAADILDRSAYSVREWCRLGRVKAEKRACGRGAAKEWMISNEELQRIKEQGLLPVRLSP